MRYASLSSVDPLSGGGVQIELFRSLDGLPRGWFIGPLLQKGQRFFLPFLPMETNALAAVAVVRAVEVAEMYDLSINVFDPDHLWEEIWR